MGQLMYLLLVQLGVSPLSTKCKRQSMCPLLRLPHSLRSTPTSLLADLTAESKATLQTSGAARRDSPPARRVSGILL